MKKMIVFVVSFIVIFSAFLFGTEILSGIFLTSRYVPDVNEAWHTSASLSQEVQLFGSGSMFSLTLLAGLLSAIIAYFAAQKFRRQN